ncbi:MAG: peptidase S41, partial [Bacteroidetes bacterium]|nr:peptidase S41 [Bacteroidota bacterium]
MKNIHNSKYSVRLPFLLAVAIAAGIFIGASMADPKTPSNALLSTLIKFREIITFVDKDYVDDVDTDNLVEEAIVEMLEKLDPHSVYIPKEEMELTRSELEGAFDGIGIEFSIIKDTIYVIAPLSGGPSEKVGLQTGDKIITVEG